MSSFRREVKAPSSLKGVVTLAVAFTFLLSALICSLPGETYVTKRRVSIDTNINSDVKTRFKKSTDEPDRCNVRTPSVEDMVRLQLNYRDNGSDKQHLYYDISESGALCFVKTDCLGQNVLSVKCKTKGCSHFVVNSEHSDLPQFDVSPESLQGIVGLQWNNKTPIKLQCHKGKPHNILDGNWQTLHIQQRKKHGCKGNKTGASTAPRIHVLNVRFLSRWEVFTRMKGLTELATSKTFSGMRALDFPKYQSAAWSDVDNLAMLLQGHTFQNDSNYTLLDAAKEKGFNVRVFDLSEENYQRTLNLKSVVKDDKLECLNAQGKQGGIFDQIPSCDCSIYQGAELYPEQKLAHLTNCLSRVNSMDVHNGLLTMTFLQNTNWDGSFEHTADVAITNIVRNIISEDNGAIIYVLSDVGNPSFDNLYNSLFLQTQSSNPFLFIFYPTASEVEDKHSILAENRDKLISLRDIHVTISDFLSSDVDFDFRSKYEGGTDRYKGLSLVGSIIPSRTPDMIGVRSPNLGICENQSIPYLNDTVQVAYAETAVGLINNYIQKKTKTASSIMSYKTPKCHVVVGKRFLNLRKSHIGETGFTTMDLEIRIVSTNIVKMLTGITVQVQSFAGANHTASLDSKTGNIETILDKVLLPLVCTERFNVNMSLIPSHEIPLIFARAKSFGSRPTIKSIHSQCLLLVIHSFKDSASYYVMNVCDDREYSFTFSGHLINVYSITQMPVRFYLLPGQMYYITSFVKVSYFHTKYSFHYETYYDMKVI